MKVGWLRLRLASFGYALRGLGTMLGEQPHAQFHALATLVVIGLGFWLDLGRSDWQFLIIAVALVWLAEGLNTALEYLADAAVPEQHPLIAKAKDVAAGAVLTSAIFAAILGVLIFLPYLP